MMDPYDRKELYKQVQELPIGKAIKLCVVRGRNSLNYFVEAFSLIFTSDETD